MMLTKTVTKFIISGSMAALVNFGTFFILLSVLEIYYLLSSVIAFSFAAVTSFCLQKFWTFESLSFKKIFTQFPLFVGVIVLNLLVNTLLVYSFVNIFNLGAFISQVLAGVIVATESFFVFRHVVFRAGSEESSKSYK